VRQKRQVVALFFQHSASCLQRVYFSQLRLPLRLKRLQVRLALGDGVSLYSLRLALGGFNLRQLGLAANSAGSASNAATIASITTLVTSGVAIVNVLS
jgi:hypothetical protein